MEEKKFNYIKVLGILGAALLILFGSFNNIWRTIRLAGDKIKEGRN